jgi:hypothetical protein
MANKLKKSDNFQKVTKNKINASDNSVNHNTETISSTKSAPVVVLEEFYDDNIHRTRPITNKEMERLRADMIDWSKKKGTIHLHRFFMERGIGDETYLSWKKRYPEFERDYVRAKVNLGLKRHELMLSGKIRERVGMFIQGKYESEWQEKESHLERLSEKNSQNASNFTIQMESFAHDEKDVPTE